jgi:hypothetical protein
MQTFSAKVIEGELERAARLDPIHGLQGVGYEGEALPIGWHELAVCDGCIVLPLQSIAMCVCTQGVDDILQGPVLGGSTCRCQHSPRASEVPIHLALAMVAREELQGHSVGFVGLQEVLDDAAEESAAFQLGASIREKKPPCDKMASPPPRC